MKRKSFALGLGCLLLLVATSAVSPEPVKVPTIEQPDLSKMAPWPVTRIVDGDTIVASLDGKDTTIRLIGVDAPETVHPSKPVEVYGKEASRFTTNLLRGEQVYLLADEQQGDKDRYGRALRYVYRAPDGLFVNAEIIRQGYGHAYTVYPFKYMEEFRQLEDFARRAQKGLWVPAGAGDIRSTTEPVAPPSATVETPRSSDSNQVTVYVTRTGRKYHRAGCRYLSKSCIPMTLEEARSRGYSPCSVCDPPR
jgi:micrococcal nuclease